jgi:hypothetical protein
MTTPATAPTTTAAVPPRNLGPLFAGYALVVIVAAWVAGIALAQRDPLSGSTNPGASSACLGLGMMDTFDPVTGPHHL